MNGILPTTLMKIQGPTVVAESPTKVEIGHLEIVNGSLVDLRHEHGNITGAPPHIRNN